MTYKVKRTSDTNSLSHHGILGQKWGVRRYQNPDGTLTEAGKKRLEKKDVKWASKNYDKIYNKSYKSSKKAIKSFVDKELTSEYAKINRGYINSYNQKLAVLMTEAAKKYSAPSGRAVKFVAKRGEVGVHLLLADHDYDIQNLKNGIWDDGRIAYKREKVNMG